MDRSDMFHKLIYLVLMPLVCLSLYLSLPLLLIFKFTHTIIQYLLSSDSIKGKVVLITGAASGIGEQMAYQYAKRGAILVIVDKNGHELPKVAETAGGLGSPHVLQICADVSNVEDCKRFVDETIKHFGQLDHLINNAGIASVSSLEDVKDITKLTHVMDVNFWGFVYPTHFAIPHLKKSKGKILVISSVSALMHPPTLGFYGASKSAVKTFFETLRSELAPSISVTIATLGFIDSNMTRTVHSSQVNQEQLFRSFPMMTSRATAEALVNGVERGKRNVTEPKWYKAFIMIEAFYPQLVDWYYHRIFMPKVIKRHLLDKPLISSQFKAD